MSDIKRAEVKIITTQQFDDETLIKHFKGELEREQLSKKLQEMANFMDACYDLIRKYTSRLKVIPMMVRLLKYSDGQYISQATAYRIYNKTQRLFGESDIKDQKFHIDIELGRLEERIQACVILKDYKSIAALSKIKQTYIMAMGSGDAVLYDDIKLPEIQIGWFPRSSIVKLPKDKELKKLISDKLQNIAEDVDIEK
jgi:hypothetical protein